MDVYTHRSNIIIRDNDFRIIELEIKFNLSSQNIWETLIALTRVYSKPDTTLQLFREIFERFFYSMGIEGNKTSGIVNRLHYSRTLLIENTINPQELMNFLIEKMKESIEQTLPAEITFLDPADHKKFLSNSPFFEPTEINCRLELFPLPIKCTCGYGTVPGQFFLYWYGTGMLRLRNRSNSQEECGVIICPKCQKTINIVPLNLIPLDLIFAKTG